MGDRRVGFGKSPLKTGDFGVSYRALGGIYAAERDFPRAEKAYVESLRIRPDSPATANNLGNVYLELEQLPEARKWFLFAIEKDPASVQAYNGLGICLWRMDRRFEANESFQGRDDGKAAKTIPG